MLTVISMFLPCTQWVFGPLSPVSSVEAVVAGNELLLNVELARVRDLQGAFAPIVVEGRLTPESVEGGHLTEASKEGLAEEGNDREETSL